jgi:predicted RNase H-like HicB family nuclease
MVTTDTVEGIIDGTVHFHYDVPGDVLYLRLLAATEAATYADVTDEGDFLLRDQTSDRPVGLTVIEWRKRLGLGSLPDLLSTLATDVEPWVKKVIASAAVPDVASPPAASAAVSNRKRYVYITEKAADGTYSAYVPDLPGCTTSGDTVDEVRMSIKDAVDSYIDSLRDDGDPVPEPTRCAGSVEAA